MQKSIALAIGTIAAFVTIAALVVQPTALMAQTSANSTSSTPAPTASSQPVCGEVVKQSVTLTANLNCSGDGLIVGADGVTINLNGFFLTGPGLNSSTRGIIVPNVGGVTILGPSVISGFGTAIDYSGGTGGGNVSSIIISGNGNGISLTGTRGVFISDNLINNNRVGITSQSSSGGNITSNIINKNSLSGVVMVNTQNLGLNTNNVIDDAQSGVFVDSQSNGNNIGFNNVFGNSVDVNNANGLPLNINNNNFHDNNCLTSNPGGLCIGR